VRGKEGFSLGTCSARASQASRMRVASASQLCNYLLRFHLTICNYNSYLYKILNIAYYIIN